MSQLLKVEVLVNKEDHGFQILIKFRYILTDTLGFPGDASGKVQETQETWVQSLGREDLPEKEMAAHSSILAWEIHGQRSLEGYSPRGSQRANMYTLCTHIYIYIYPN